MQPGAVVDVVDGDGVVVALTDDVEVELVVATVVTVPPRVVEVVVALTNDVEVELDVATVPIVVEVDDEAGVCRPQSGGVEAELDWHAFRLRFRVATQAARQALPGLRAGQAALHAFVCWVNSRLQSRGHRAATAVALTISTAAMAIATRLAHSLASAPSPITSTRAWAVVRARRAV